MSTEDSTHQPQQLFAAADPAPGTHYEIRVEGHLGTRWAAFFDGLTLTNEADGTTVIRGAVADQAALHGSLQTLRDLGVALLSLSRITQEDAIERPDLASHTNRHTPKGAAAS